MISKAYIHEYGNGRMEPEQAAVLEVLSARGISCETFTAKRLQRAQLRLDGSTFVAGDHTVMGLAFRQLGMDVPTDCYPQSLHSYLGRRVWKTTVGRLLSEERQADPGPLFVKPASKAKLFTGGVLHSSAELMYLEIFSKHTALYCSDPVRWLSEFRVFVCRSRIVGIGHYAGDARLKPNMRLVAAAVSTLEDSGERTDGYAIDFGVLENGQTTVVEWNDGFALGAYGIDRKIYTDLLTARWNELAAKIISPFF